MLVEISAFLEAFAMDFLVLALQEITDGEVQDGQSDMIPIPKLDATLLLGKPRGCFRPVGLLIDDQVCTVSSKVKVGRSHLLTLLQFEGWEAHICMASIHFPHSHRPFEDFQAAVESLHADLQASVSRELPIVILGDFNVCLLQECCWGMG